VFTQDREAARLAATVARLRAQAVAAGRPADSVKIINGASFVIADTVEEAQRLRAELNATPTREATAALFLGWSGVDLGALDPDATLDSVSTEVGHTMIEMWRNPNGTSPTVGEILDSLASTFGGMRFTGTAESIAIEVAALVEETDIDGFLVENWYGGYEGYRDFVEMLMPVLRARGLLPAVARSGTLRSMLTGQSDVPEWHPARAVRGAQSGK
jgi:alkanesulfonate monooxygenase SsuD/methylene tetrahydromethanopterin reductase-like flavin-dependent oxidoreductase (luciferase family)